MVQSYHGCPHASRSSRPATRRPSKRMEHRRVGRARPAARADSRRASPHLREPTYAPTPWARSSKANFLLATARSRLGALRRTVEPPLTGRYSATAHPDVIVEWSKDPLGAARAAGGADCGVPAHDHEDGGADALAHEVRELARLALVRLRAPRPLLDNAARDAVVQPAGRCRRRRAAAGGGARRVPARELPRDGGRLGRLGAAHLVPRARGARDARRRRLRDLPGVGRAHRLRADGRGRAARRARDGAAGAEDLRQAERAGAPRVGCRRRRRVPRRRRPARACSRRTRRLRCGGAARAPTSTSPRTTRWRCAPTSRCRRCCSTPRTTSCARSTSRAPTSSAPSCRARCC